MSTPEKIKRKKEEPYFVHLLVRISEKYRGLEFERVVACRLAGSLEPKELLEAVTEYAKGVHDDIDDVEEQGSGRFVGPSGVEVKVKSVSSLTRDSWELFRAENMLNTVCL